jgi:hypothetical protein
MTLKFVLICLSFLNSILLFYQPCFLLIRDPKKHHLVDFKSVPYPIHCSIPSALIIQNHLEVVGDIFLCISDHFFLPNSSYDELMLSYRRLRSSSYLAFERYFWKWREKEMIISQIYMGCIHKQWDQNKHCQLQREQLLFYSTTLKHNVTKKVPYLTRKT